MEAMATEVPVVSTNISGIPELIRDGETGLLVREKDSLALAEAMGQLLADDEKRIQLGKNGRQRVLQEFNIERNVAKLAAILSPHET
jgi:glycosyltransferase involved in cell wall biosynthesis